MKAKEREKLPRKYRLKLSKKAKRQILEYLSYRQNRIIDKLQFALNQNIYNDLWSEYYYIQNLKLDIEYFGVK